MAESNFIEVIDHQLTSNDKFQSVVRRKLDRFRAKLTELLFSSASNNNQNTVNFNNSKKNHSRNPHSPSSNQQKPDDNSSLQISNYYYGYTSPISEEDLRLSCKNKKSKKFHKNITSSSSSSSACSSSSSMIIDDDEHSTLSQYTSQPHTGELILSQYPVNFDSHFMLPQSLTTGVITLNTNSHINNNISNQQQPSTLDYYSFNSQLNSNHSNYDTSSLNTNEEENPFLNKRLTDQIHFNSDLTQLSAHFEHALDLIDDMDNFFSIDFMTNYIAYILLKQLKDSNLLQQMRWELKFASNDKNLLKEIAEQIFLESRDEPCGLKGCNISIYVQDVLSESQNNQNSLVTRFQFGESRFGAFDMNLFLKTDATQANVNNQEKEQSAIATLTRRIFSNNTNSSASKAKQFMTCDSFRTVFLDSTSYDLFKTNLAYA